MNIQNHIDFIVPPTEVALMEPPKNPWIAWNGGTRPVPSTQMVQFLSPVLGTFKCRASAVNWGLNEGAYRLVNTIN